MQRSEFCTPRERAGFELSLEYTRVQIKPKASDSIGIGSSEAHFRKKRYPI